MIKQVCALLAVMVLLGGCSQLPEKPDDASQLSLWQLHEHQVSQVSAWHIDGRIGIRTERQSGSASLFWKQQGANFEMRIVAPLGQGTYILTGSAAGVQMRGPDDLLLSADTPEELMQRGLGWSIDLQGLRYWIRGLPAPVSEYTNFEFDGYGRLHKLDQSGFEVEIQRYAEVKQLALPEKLSVKNGDLQLKMLIKRWEI